MKKLRGQERGRGRDVVSASHDLTGARSARAHQGRHGIYMYMRRCSWLGAWWATAMPPGGKEWISRA